MIDVLQTLPMHRTTQEALAEGYRVHKLFEAADKAAFLAEVGPMIRAATPGMVSADLMAQLPALEIIANFGVGYDSVDTEAAAARGIRVTNTPDVLNDAVAELAIGMMTALARRIPAQDRFVREGRWGREKGTLSSTLNGKKLGILGLGRIGLEIANRASAMKMHVSYHNRTPRSDVPYTYHESLLGMARDVDWLLLIAPGGAQTQGLVSREVLEALGPKGTLVNLSRGSVVDEEALVELLLSGGLGGAALDVFAQEPKVPEALFDLPNVLLQPHLGSATFETRDAMGQLVLDNLAAHFAGEPLLTPVV